MVIVGTVNSVNSGTGSLGSILGLSAADEPEEQPTIVKEVNIIIQRMDGTYTSPVLHLGFKPNYVFFFFADYLCKRGQYHNPTNVWRRRRAWY